jgi:hypothetical protein
MRPRTVDVGEILTGLCTLLGQDMIYHLSPEETLVNSIRTVAACYIPNYLGLGDLSPNEW